MSNNELRHFKYVDKYKKNGKWIYVYPGENATKNAFGQVRGGTGGSLQAHQRLNREATNQVAKNTPSRNVPGANDQSALKPGNKMSKAAVNSAKTAAAQYRQEKIDSHARALEYGHREALAKGYSKNIAPYKDRAESANESRGLMPQKNLVNQTTKKQIRQGIRKAKIKTLKRDAAQAISRAQDWLKKLFD